MDDLSQVIQSALLRKEAGRGHDLEVELRKNKAKFLALLKNPAKSPSDADLVRKAQTDGIRLDGSGNGNVVEKLPSSVVEESLILSDMFNLNEIAALQLLLKGEGQLCQHPGLTRGLIAVLIYYDKRKTLVQSLRTLIQARPGNSWTLEGISADVRQLVVDFTDQLMEEGLTEKVLTLLKELDWNQEALMLNKNLALGDPKHRYQVKTLFEEIRNALSDSVFCFAAQSGLNKADSLRLLAHFARMKPGEGFDAAGRLDYETLALLLALVYSLNRAEDGDFVAEVHKEVMHKTWLNPHLKSVVQLAWSMRLCQLRENSALAAVEDDENLADLALEADCLKHLTDLVLDSPHFARDEFYTRLVHKLLTDFIVCMPLKVKELRNRADDAARNLLMHEQEGIRFTPPGSSLNFEQLLKALSKLYSKSKIPDLVLDFWCPLEGGSGSGGDRLPHLQVSLYKFVRLAGDLLMPSLYVHYIDLLVSLSGHPQASLHCFNMLKMNGTVSWDHFFTSLHQYFSNLKREAELAQSMLPNSDTIYKPRGPMHRGISPAEIEGLSAVLRLIGQVASHCEPARLAMAENSHWQPVLVCTGLLVCPVPNVLKAKLLNVLRSLAKSVEVSGVIWQHLEAGGAASGFNSELENVETRNEEYPMTESFLQLVDGLLETGGIPLNLGQGTRKPGFEPYLDLIRDAIFLRFNTRNYKRTGEKWTLAAGCLQVFLRILTSYNPNPNDFTEQAPKHPGFYLMLHLLQSSELLRILLFIVDEAKRVLELFAKAEELTSTSLHAMSILEKALDIQGQFLDAAKASNSSYLLTPLDQLLQGVNPRSGRADHTLNVAKVMTFSWCLPEHASKAVKIISWVAQSASAHPGLLSTFNDNGVEAKVIVKGFTDILDSEDDDLEAARLSVLNLIQSGLDKANPSLSHFLLGFDVKPGSSVAKSSLQPQGVLGTVRSPLHAVLGILKPGPGGEAPTAFTTCPRLAESCYRLLYFLSANRLTSEPTLRFLRGSEDFLCAQLRLLPLDLDSPWLVKGVSWLLKTLAIELKQVSSNRMRYQISNLINVLLDVGGCDKEDEAKSVDESVNEMAYSQLSRTFQSSSRSNKREMIHRQRQHRLLEILNGIDFAESIVEAPEWTLFDRSQVNQVMKGCLTEAPNIITIDIPKLHKILNDELSNFGPGQKSLIQEEIKAILVYALKWNSTQEENAVKRSLLDSWRQVTEVMLCSVPQDILPDRLRQQLLLDLIQTLLTKVLAEGTMAEMANQVSGVVLLLLTALRQTYNVARRPNEAKDQTFVSILDAASGLARGDNDNLVYSSGLNVILKGVVTWIINTSSASQRVRANLYGALLHYLRIGGGSADLDLVNHDKAQFRKANLEIIVTNGEALFDALCKDSISGHDIRRMLALSLLDELIHLAGHKASWTYYMSNQGYLRHIVESMSAEDANLMSLLDPNVQDLKSLYVYESKMALLARLACTKTGAECLLESGLMSRLAEMKVFGSRPDLSPAVFDEDDERDLIPSALTRYHQILFPALRLCQAALASLGVQNDSASGQIRHFIQSNDDLIKTLLKTRGIWSLNQIQELALITALIARTYSADENWNYQRQMLALLPHFALSDECLLQVRRNLPETKLDSAVQALIEVNLNVLLFARNASLILFAPSLTEALFVDHQDPNRVPQPSSFRSVTLGHLVLALRYLCKRVKNGDLELNDIRHKFNLDGLSANELNAVLPKSIPDAVKDRMSLSEKKEKAERIVEEKARSKESEVRLGLASVEVASILLLRHAEYFLLEASQPASQFQRDHRRRLNAVQQQTTPSSRFVPDLVEDETVLEVDSATTEKLRDEVKVCFTEAFYEDLESSSRIGKLLKKKSGEFLDVSIRKLKRISTIHV